MQHLGLCTPTLSESARSLEHLRELIRFARTVAAICRIAVNIHVDIHSNNGDVFYLPGLPSRGPWAQSTLKPGGLGGGQMVLHHHLTMKFNVNQCADFHDGVHLRGKGSLNLACPCK